MFTLLFRWITCQCRDYQPYSLDTLMTLMRMTSDINLVLDWINWVEVRTSDLGANPRIGTVRGNVLIYLLLSFTIVASVIWAIIAIYLLVMVNSNQKFCSLSIPTTPITLLFDSQIGKWYQKQQRTSSISSSQSAGSKLTCNFQVL